VVFEGKSMMELSYHPYSQGGSLSMGESPLGVEQEVGLYISIDSEADFSNVRKAQLYKWYMGIYIGRENPRVTGGDACPILTRG
jgi:hypothetical protein